MSEPTTLANIPSALLPPRVLTDHTKAGDAMDQGNISTPDAADLNTAAREYAASQGWALSNGSYPIRPANLHGRRDLAKAILALGRGNMSSATIKAHILKRARAIGATELLPSSWNAA